MDLYHFDTSPSNPLPFDEDFHASYFIYIHLLELTHHDQRTPFGQDEPKQALYTFWIFCFANLFVVLETLYYTK